MAKKPKAESLTEEMNDAKAIKSGKMSLAQYAKSEKKEAKPAKRLLNKKG